MTGRRHQVLMAGLTDAGLYELSPAGDSTVQALVERLDEAAVRRVAHWPATAGDTRYPGRFGRRCAGQADSRRLLATGS
ncbi:hypothetical protein ACFZCT_37815 [Streptomyces qaidamensis]|uniref:hypothetical protein n=1 Tax=Streptomyces qaidamensis TaxID=1783515 RepID=UPI0036EF71D2